MRWPVALERWRPLGKSLNPHTALNSAVGNAAMLSGSKMINFSSYHINRVRIIMLQLGLTSQRFVGQLHSYARLHTGRKFQVNYV